MKQEKTNNELKIGNLVYFIERLDTREWYTGYKEWTNDPLKAKLFNSKEFAETFLQQCTDPQLWSERSEELWYIDTPFPECEITEHIFDF